MNGDRVITIFFTGLLSTILVGREEPGTDQEADASDQHDGNDQEHAGRQVCHVLAIKNRDRVDGAEEFSEET